jgi:molybdate transport system substrate-binding protein
MFTRKLKTLALCALPFAALASSSVHATTTINVAVAANFGNTIIDIISQFKNTYPGVDVHYFTDSSANLQTQIINHTVAYDLFLSADKTRPQQLATTYPTLVIGSPFLYAVGELELWSPSYDISAGLPAPLAADIVLADPNKAPYGTAAAQVLSSSPWSVTWPANPYPVAGTAHIFTKSNITQTYGAIKGNTYAYGFIHQSAICKVPVPGGAKVFSSGYHHTYPYNVAPTHNRIEQYAIKVVNTRTTAQETELTNFINFLQTDPVGTGIVLSYCYSLT